MYFSNGIRSPMVPASAYLGGGLLVSRLCYHVGLRWTVDSLGGPSEWSLLYGDSGPRYFGMPSEGLPSG